MKDCKITLLTLKCAVSLVRGNWKYLKPETVQRGSHKYWKPMVYPTEKFKNSLNKYLQGKPEQPGLGGFRRRAGRGLQQPD